MLVPGPVERWGKLRGWLRGESLRDEPDERVLQALRTRSGAVLSGD